MKGPRGTDSARVVSVIETRALRGTGTEKDKCRIVIQYWDFEGNLLAENDPCGVRSNDTRSGCDKRKISIRPCERYVGKCDQGSVKRCTNEDKRYGGIDHGKINT